MAYWLYRTNWLVYFCFLIWNHSDHCTCRLLRILPVWGLHAGWDTVSAGGIALRSPGMRDVHCRDRAFAAGLAVYAAVAWWDSCTRTVKCYHRLILQMSKLRFSKITVNLSKVAHTLLEVSFLWSQMPQSSPERSSVFFSPCRCSPPPRSELLLGCTAFWLFDLGCACYLEVHFSFWIRP